MQSELTLVGNGNVVLTIPELRRLKLCWNEDVPNGESNEWVYVVVENPECEILYGFILDETSDGIKGFRGPFRFVFDGHTFPIKIPMNDPKTNAIYAKHINHNGQRKHAARMAAIAVLLNAGVVIGGE